MQFILYFINWTDGGKIMYTGFASRVINPDNYFLIRYSIKNIGNYLY